MKIAKDAVKRRQLQLAQRVFHFAPVHISDLAYGVAPGLARPLWFNLVTLGQNWARTLLARGNTTPA